VHHVLVVGLFVTAAVVLVTLLWIPAPYGRHQRTGWGPNLPQRIGWLVMESPAVLAFVAFYLRGRHALAWVPLTLCGMWLAHYLHRTLVYPFRFRAGADATTPVVVVAMAIAFNLANAYVNSTQLSELGDYPTSWLGDGRFLAGAGLFALGYGINRWADRVLRSLRQPGEHAYRVPRGGLYELVSCPNYLGEMLEWIGWAVATWSLAGLSFAAFTIANLLPRALSHHRWYRARFADYPPHRRAVVPFVL
jgi:protein-S-isoprenylcysteine O-methyltransferase Ste14